MKNLICFLLCFAAFITPCPGPLPSEKVGAVLSIENGVVSGMHLPDWGVVCDVTPVFSRPDTHSKVMHTLPKGQKVRIREGSADNTFAMIGISEWVETTSLCKDR